MSRTPNFVNAEKAAPRPPRDRASRRWPVHLDDGVKAEYARMLQLFANQHELPGIFAAS